MCPYDLPKSRKNVLCAVELAMLTVLTTAPTAVQRWMVMGMLNKDVIAYAVDADTGHITWVIYGERKDNG